MTLEIALRGGRVTESVVKVNNTVRRPHKATSDFTNSILIFLHENNFHSCPEFLGRDEQGRDVYSFIEGYVPNDIGDTTILQLCSFMKLLRMFHDLSAIFLNSSEKVVCHNDPSPCNTVFLDGEPIALIDWDDAAVGERWEDLAYVLWLWINIGSHNRDEIHIMEHIKEALSAYGADANIKVDFAEKLLKRMDKVLEETLKTNPLYEKIVEWVLFSKEWVFENKDNIRQMMG